MLKAIAWKECRELFPLVGIALLIQCYLISGATGVSWGAVSDWTRPFAANATPDSSVIPFIDSESGDLSVAKLICLVGAACGIGLGLWQTMWESSQGTFQFLLHRPLQREQIIGVKMVLGAVMCLLVAALPLLYYSLWAAAPGTHASPFTWSMTTSAWMLCLEIPLVYLGAFLSGLRPGRWFGSRFLPLIATVVTLFLLRYLPISLPQIAPWEWIALAIVVFFDVCFVFTIFSVARARDFS